MQCRKITYSILLPLCLLSLTKRQKLYLSFYFYIILVSFSQVTFIVFKIIIPTLTSTILLYLHNLLFFFFVLSILLFVCSLGLIEKKKKVNNPRKKIKMTTSFENIQISKFQYQVIGNIQLINLTFFNSIKFREKAECTHIFKISSCNKTATVPSE